jgi:hypothetical protein
MSAKSGTRGARLLGMTIEHDREITLWLAALFVICGLLLAQEIRRCVQGHFFGPTHIHMSFSSIFPKVFEVICAVYFFMFAFSIPKKSVKIASTLMGADLAVFALLSCFPVTPTAGQIIGMIGSAVRQIALTIFCVAIVQWFKSSVRRSSPTDPQENDYSPSA